MTKKRLKNILEVELPFYKIKPGETKEIEITAPDDIHLRGIQLGHLKEVSATETKAYTLEELEKLSFKELRKIGYNLGTKGRSKKELIKEILELSE